MRSTLTSALVLVAIAASPAESMAAGVVVKILSPTTRAGVGIDMEHARPIMRQLRHRLSEKRLKKLIRKDRRAARKERRKDRGSAAAPQAYNGSGVSPYTLARVDLPLDSPNAAIYQRVGKLYAAFGSSTNVVSCTAALIKPGILVTAGECVSAFGKGPGGIATSAAFVPAVDSSLKQPEPFGVWTAKAILVPDAYTSSGDTAWHENDLALVVLAPQDGQRLGDKVGYFQYSSSTASYAPANSPAPEYFSQKEANITILGYSSIFDGGERMIRSHSTALLTIWPDEKSAKNEENYLLDTESSLSGGSLGAPWIINLGTAPAVAPGYSLGKSPIQQIIGVTNAGNSVGAYPYYGLHGTYFGRNKSYNSPYPYSVHGYGNIGFIVTKACTLLETKDAC